MGEGRAKKVGRSKAQNVTGRHGQLAEDRISKVSDLNEMKYVPCKFAAISVSALSPFANSFSLLYSNSSLVSVENSWF